MLQEVEDVLFVLDSAGVVLSCKARVGSNLNFFPIQPGRLLIHDLLPLSMLNKFEHAFQQARESGHFVLFESMLTLPPRDVSWLEFRLLPALGNQVLMFIWNVNGYKDILRTVANLSLSAQKMTEGWARALYLRDFETDDHTRRVVNMTVQLARRLGLPEEEIGIIRRGAEVHDIGKLAIPDEVLLKAGALSDDEWALMRKHPLIAVDLLEPISQFAPALVIPRSHHEKWDGSGYPDGLAGVDIPLPARLFAFADVYDALTSNRPYRNAWSRSDALNYIRRESGRHFDPSLTPEFIRMVSE
jgi:HD-GYP domain-containing protein (c-di-GMP phosphodiesterase class II)